MANENTTTSTTNNVTVHDSNHEFRLEFLCSLIPKSFDGKRSEFHEFITNCENSHLLATERQKHPLLVYIISKLTGAVRTQLHGKTNANWHELKAILNQLYVDKNYYVQLMEELNSLRQSSHESVTSFHERIDQLSTRIINSFTFKDKSEEIGKIETIKELALNRFIYHSTPDISRFLRSQNIEKLSDALSKAVDEERALKMSKSEFKPSNQNNKFCNTCRKSGHNTRDCFKNMPYNNTKPSTKSQVFVNQNFSQNRNFTNSNGNQKFCRYCKANGHLIHECRKRGYANKFRTNPNTSDTNNNNKFRSSTQNRIPENVNLNSAHPQVGVEPVEIQDTNSNDSDGIKLLKDNLRLDHLNAEERKSVLETCIQFHDIFLAK